MAEQDRIAWLDVERGQVPALVTRTGADCEHFALLGPFPGCVGYDDAALGRQIAFRASNDDAIVEGTEFHECSF
ncbi:hypothetical protein QW131_17820 [Roseibium salinum]|nr:hypothetical protein [Roseibium salinum]